MRTSIAIKWGMRSLFTVLLFAATYLPLRADGNPDGFQRTYKWKFDGKWHTFTYELPWETYSFYQEKPRVYSNYAVYVYENPRFRIISDFTQALKEQADNLAYDDWKTIEFMVAFVQQLEYVTEQGEYPKFPIETLADKGGDCEDTAILLAAMLKELNYDVLLINPPGHMALALACNNCDGMAYSRNGRKYYYIETTGAGFQVGEIPKEYRTTKDVVVGLEVLDNELWVLTEAANNFKSANSAYYVQEDDDTDYEHSESGKRIVTNRTVRTVTINGQTFVTTSVTQWEE